MAVTLEALGVLLRQTQAEMRTVRGEVDALREEVNGMVPAVAEVVRASERRIMDRIASLEALVESKFDQAPE